MYNLSLVLLSFDLLIQKERTSPGKLYLKKTLPSLFLGVTFSTIPKENLKLLFTYSVNLNCFYGSFPKSPIVLFIFNRSQNLHRHLHNKISFYPRNLWKLFWTLVQPIFQKHDLFLVFAIFQSSKDRNWCCDLGCLHQSSLTCFHWFTEYCSRKRISHFRFSYGVRILGRTWTWTVNKYWKLS